MLKCNFTGLLWNKVGLQNYKQLQYISLLTLAPIIISIYRMCFWSCKMASWWNMLIIALLHHTLATKRLVEHANTWFAPSHSGYNDYLSLHSPCQMKETFIEVLLPIQSISNSPFLHSLSYPRLRFGRDMVEIVKIRPILKKRKKKWNFLLLIQRSNIT